VHLQTQVKEVNEMTVQDEIVKTPSNIDSTRMIHNSISIKEMTDKKSIG
jgi:hypothetical protein